MDQQNNAPDSMINQQKEEQSSQNAASSSAKEAAQILSFSPTPTFDGSDLRSHSKNHRQ